MLSSGGGAGRRVSSAPAERSEMRAGDLYTYAPGSLATLARLPGLGQRERGARGPFPFPFDTSP